MKLVAITAAAALALAGAALAQSTATDHGTSGGAVNTPGELPNWSSPYVTTQQKRAVAAYRETVQAYNLACSVDQRTLCQGRRTDGDIWACMRIHRSKLTEPCRQATYAVEHARQFLSG